MRTSYFSNKNAFLLLLFYKNREQEDKTGPFWGLGTNGHWEDTGKGGLG
jgi:hypothetical protein